MRHELKIFGCYFEPVLSGVKTFEIRDNRDRGFQAGDTVTLKECERLAGGGYAYTGRKIEKRITYVTDFEQKPGFVVFGIADI